MMNLSRTLAVTLSVLFTVSSLASAQDACPTNAHKVNSLPYWKDGVKLPCMYAGTLQTGLTDKQDHNLFYWLFKNTAVTDGPLIMWINGGPGASSMFGLFLENGPLRVKRAGAKLDEFEVNLATEGSWNDYGDIFFLDQPVGTGFSHGTSPLLTTMEDGAEEVKNFLLKFYEMYPEYVNRKVILSGESYAGKYLPHIAAKFRTIDKVKDNLHAVLIGDPFTSPIRQRTSTHLIAQGTGITDPTLMHQVAALRSQCENTMSKDWMAGASACTQTMDYIDDMAGKLFTYDGTIFDEDWNRVEQPVKDYLSTLNKKSDDLYKAIHVADSKKKPIFEMESAAVDKAYAAETMLDWSPYYDKIIGDVHILVYSGEYDQRDGPLTQNPWLKELLALKYDHNDLWT